MSDEVKWIKITTSMFDDEKIKLIEGMPDRDTILIIWVKLLTQAGKCNATGHLILSENIPYTDEMLSTIFNRPLNTVRMALDIFSKFGMIEYLDDAIFISNWQKHQNIVGMELIRKQTSERVKKHREKLKQLKQSNATCNVTVTHGNALELELELESDIEKEIKPKDKKLDIFSEINSYTDKPELIQALKDFVEHRKAIKKPVRTAKTLHLIFNELEKHSDSDKIAVINQSVMNGWVGLFPLNRDKKQQDKPSNRGGFDQRTYSDEFYDKLYENGGG